MIQKLKIGTWFVLAAFAVVFLFGCVFQVIGDTGMNMQSLDSGVGHQQSLPSHANDHMDVVMAFPSLSQSISFFAALLVFLGFIVTRFCNQTSYIEPVPVQWRHRSRREVFSEWSAFTHLFRTGLLNPKIH